MQGFYFRDVALTWNPHIHIGGICAKILIGTSISVENHEHK